MGGSMAKARPLRKAGRKSGSKPAKNRRQPGAGAQPKRPAAKPARAAQSNRASTPVRQKVVAGGAVRVAERPVVSPEIPPPLPAPIASFTF